MDIRTKTARSSGAVGKNAVVPRVIKELFNNNSMKNMWQILDYGCGKDQIHVQDLSSFGFKCVGGYDISLPLSREALRYNYHLVYASNVLNVQADQQQVEEVLAEVSSVLRGCGIFICNYPAEPRKSKITTKGMEYILARFFHHVVRIEKVVDSQTPVFMCANRR